MKVGIIGFEFAGKKSLFSLLTGIKKESHLLAKKELGTVDVPDERIEYLAKYYRTEKKTYSKIEFSLMPSLKNDSEEDKEVLLAAKEVDMFCIVVRQFFDESVFHPQGKIDFVRDYNKIKDELLFADLFLVEIRLERINTQSKTKKSSANDFEKDLMLRLKDALEKGIFLSALKLDGDLLKIAKGLNFLTLKPIFVVVNCDEDKLIHKFELHKGVKSINISIKIETEIQMLDEKSKLEFLSALSLNESSLNRLIKFSYEFGNLISFLTAGPKEVHSWTIEKGTKAHESAGVIHSDIEKGFIRAEVINFEDFKKAGSETKARESDFYRLEGKGYIVKDGDIMDFRFNVSK
ncbi:MAG: DUF933 domain-containing protein [Elusimicrobia bacterium]|nr:DUF933 domain-containing protein [Elusimicrobiota bacterium]